MKRAPRAVVHHGSVQASGFWLKSGEESAILSLWESGCQLRRLGTGYVLSLHTPRRVDAGVASATPLVREGKWLLAAPLRARELASLPAGSDLVLVDAGELRDFELGRLTLVDPAEWLDVSRFELREAAPRRAAPPPAAALVPGAAAETLFADAVGRSAADQAKRAGLARALSDLASGRAGNAPQGARVGGALRRGVLALLQNLAIWLTRSARTDASSPHALSKAPRAPRAWARLTAALARWLASTRVGAYIGRKNAEYLRELFDLLAHHDDEQVLRRAIPLGKGEGQSGALPSLPPGPRSLLEISLAPHAPRSSLGLGTDLYERLRRSYEAVFQRLDEAGKHEQAAYFLAEILNESERAVAYLERHRKLRLAAQLAEARNLPAGLVVRQWFLAGDRERAVLLAVREGAFEDAILRLEKAGQKSEAAALRFLQAERLASAGLLVRAAELVHGVDRGKPLALRWLELSRNGGELRGIPLELSLDASRFDAALTALQPLFGGATPDQLPTVLHLAEEFARLEVEAGKPLARELARELFAAASSEGTVRLAKAALRVTKFVGGGFKADAPPLVSFERRLGGARRSYFYPTSDAGAATVRDLHRAGSLVLVALGDAGVVLLDRQGKRVAHFDLPAEALVTSLDGSRALCVTRRGDRLEVGRIDLAKRRTARWCELAASSFARQFDGQSWFVCTSGWTQRREDSELLQLDVLDVQPRVLRRVPMPLEGPQLHLEGTHLNLVGAEPFGAIERLRYELPQLTLRQRKVLVDLGKDPASVAGRAFFVGTAAACGDSEAGVYDRWADDALSGTPAVLAFGGSQVTLPRGDLEGVAALQLHRDYYALSLTRKNDVRLLLGARSLTAPYVDVQLDGASEAAVRLYDDLVLIGDSAGRVLGLDPRSGSPLFDWRT